MHYTELNIEIEPYSQQNAEILTALLGELGFDSFVDSPKGLLAYIPTSVYNKKEVEALFKNFPFDINTRYTTTSIADQNWNKQWESNFEPITIENFCRVRAPFHQPEEGFQLEIVIEPKMAFGTGHHQTTWLMVRELFRTNLNGKTVLDMGCGTGILAIVAEKLGATNIMAIDNDSWAFENALENFVANNCSKISVLLGDASVIPNLQYDIILANINLNVLVKDMAAYALSLKPDGLLIMSGILTGDAENLINTANSKGFEHIYTEKRNDWILVLTKKL